MMTPEDQRLAIAEALGWLRPHHPDAMKWKHGWTMPEKWWLCPAGVLRFAHAIPDYPRDLNAMHEAFLTLPSRLHATFWQRLFEIVQHAYDSEHGKNAFYMLKSGRKSALVGNATALQRCEAFLRTIGKWKD